MRAEIRNIIMARDRSRRGEASNVCISLRILVQGVDQRKLHCLSYFDSFNDFLFCWVHVVVFECDFSECSMEFFQRVMVPAYSVPYFVIGCWTCFMCGISAVRRMHLPKNAPCST